MATYMANEGITGIPSIFDVEDGLSAVAGWEDPDPGALLDGLTEQWWLPNTSIKPWPCCRWIHYSLTALEQILESEGLSADEIDQIDLLTFPAFQSDPAFRNQDMGSNLVSISFSYAHAAAMVALKVPPGPDWFSPTIVQSDQARKLRHLVRTGIEPRSQSPDAWGLNEGVVKVPSTAIVTAGGREYSRTTDYARGDPWDPATIVDDNQLMEKFISLMAKTNSGKSTDEIKGYADEIIRLEKQVDLRNLQIKSLEFGGIQGSRRDVGKWPIGR
jgi:2-methylcitrate dehydratase PrpD